MANTQAVRSASESGVYRFDTAGDNVIVGPVKIQCLIYEPGAGGDTVTIENGAEVAKFIIISPEEGAAANQPLNTIVIPFPFGLRMNGMSIGAISSGSLLTVVLV